MIWYVIDNNYGYVDTIDENFEKKYQIPSKYMNLPKFKTLIDAIKFLSNANESIKKSYIIKKIENGIEEKICIGDGIYFF